MDVQHAIERGIGAARADNQATAYYYFYAATQADPSSEQAWLWRASTAPQPRDALFCLAAVLALNPENAVARHGLEQISAAVAAASDLGGDTITPSPSATDFPSPERRLEWQQAFQRELYDLAEVPYGPAAAGGVADETGAPAPREAGGLAYRRAPARDARVTKLLRRVLVDRETQRMQLAIPVVIGVVVLLGLVALLGWSQISAMPATSPLATPLAEATVRPATPLASTPPAPTAPAPTAPVPTTALPPTAVAAAATGTPSSAPALPATATAASPAAGTPAVAPTTSPTQAPAATPPPTATALPGPLPTIPPTLAPTAAGGQTVTVGAGQTLDQIAGQLNVTVAALWAYNDLTSRDLAAGQTLKVPPAGYKPAELRYTIQAGDTLSDIAHLFGASVSAIVQRNAIADENAIVSGQTITVPLP